MCVVYRTVVARILLVSIQATVILVSSTDAQKDRNQTVSLGTEFVRQPFVALPYRDLVMRFEFSPDGAETWCLCGRLETRRGVNRGRAIVFQQKNKSWRQIPLTKDHAVFHDVMFSANGKTTWIAMSSDDDRGLRIRERKTGSSKWSNLRKRMPKDYSVVEKFWQTPNGRELWLYASDAGVIRWNRQTDRLTQYVQTKVRQIDGIPHATLIEDYVNDLVFTSDSRYAVCAATGGGDHGITKIDLASGKSMNFPVTDASEFERLVMTPDNKHVWCIGDSYLWCFDLKSESWIHKLSHDQMPISWIDSLIYSPISNHIWISGFEGTARYSLTLKKWIGYTSKNWQSRHKIPEIATAPLVATVDGKNIIASHSSGVALFSADGEKCEIIKSDNPNSHSSCTHIVPIPKSSDFLCTLEFESGVGGLYRLKTKTRSLEKLFELKAPATALRISSKNRAWIAMPGNIYELDFVAKHKISHHKTKENLDSQK